MCVIFAKVTNIPFISQMIQNALLRKSTVLQWSITRAKTKWIIKGGGKASDDNTKVNVKKHKVVIILNKKGNK